MRTTIILLLAALTSVASANDLETLDAKIKALKDRGAAGTYKSITSSVFTVVQVINANAALVERGSTTYYYEGSTHGLSDDSRYYLPAVKAGRNKSFTTVLGANRTLPVLVKSPTLAIEKELYDLQYEAANISYRKAFEELKNKSFYIYTVKNTKKFKSFKYKFTITGMTIDKKGVLTLEVTDRKGYTEELTKGRCRHGILHEKTYNQIAKLATPLVDINKKYGISPNEEKE